MEEEIPGGDRPPSSDSDSTISSIDDSPNGEGNEKEFRPDNTKKDLEAQARPTDGVDNKSKLGGAQIKGNKWKSTEKKSEDASKKLEDQMNFEHLKKLEDIFQEADADGGGGLDIDEFREAMKRTMGAEVDDKELEIIFMKVDTNCDGTVDWDEYLSYMLLEYQEKDTMTSLSNEVPFPKKLKVMQSCHREFVVRIAFLQHLTIRQGNKALDGDNPGGRFLSLSKEGQLGIYGADLQFQRSVTIDPGRESFVGQWLTDMITLANVGMIAISSTEREITFFDLNASKFEKQFQVTGFKDTILTMHYWFDHEDLNYCTLVAGDASGSVVVLKFVEALNKGLFAYNPQIGVVKKIPLLSLVKHHIKGAYGMIFEDIHSNWVNSVKYFTLAQGSDCFISCSSTDNDSMYLGDLSDVTYIPKWPGFSKVFSNKSSYFKVRKGIIAFDYCKDWNVIVTGSFDGVVRTWNPYSSQPGSMIKGHMTPVQHVIIVSSSGRVVTVGRDRTIRIIELRYHLTTQVLGAHIFFRCGPLTHPLQAVFYHNRTKSLWVAAVQVGVLEGYDYNEKENQMNIKTHHGPVMSVLYNHLFNQVVTGGHDSIVSVWDLNTGVKAIQFYTVKGVEITAMTFDQTGRRLITGSRNGAVKIWNFNNGACLRTLEEETMLEVTGIVCLKQKIITGGWNKVPTVYIDAKGDDDDDDDDPCQWAEVHKEDILCLAYYQNTQGTAIVASASYDGDIFIWSVDTGHVLCRLNRLEAYVPMSIEGHKMTSVVQKNVNDFEQTANLIDPSQKLNVRTSRRDGLTIPPIELPLIAQRGQMNDEDVSAKYGFDEVPKTVPLVSRKSIRKSVKFDLLGALPPSAGPATKDEKIRHQVEIATGQAERDYWEADVSIDKLLFLQNRPHEPHTATLIASGAMGWVYSWSVHPQGGLLGQFVGAHRDGDSVFSMATDKFNKILITGDTSGYVKFWDIDNYCCKKRKRSRMKDFSAAFFRADDERLRMLSTRRMITVNRIPPEFMFYYRAHVGSITDITFVDDRQLLLTSCGDGTVRLWSTEGQYIGNFGQKHPWVLNKTLKGKMPADVKRVASSNTLKVLHSELYPWKTAKNILNIVAFGTMGHSYENTSDTDFDEESMKSLYGLGEREELTAEEIEENYQKCVEKMNRSEILGKSYKPKQRHRILPKIDIKTHLRKFHVHSSIPFSTLKEIEVIDVPEILQEKWRLRREVNSEQEKTRSAAKGSKNINLGKRRSKMARSQPSFLGTSRKIVKAVKILK